MLLPWKEFIMLSVTSGLFDKWCVGGIEEIEWKKELKVTTSFPR